MEELKITYVCTSEVKVDVELIQSIRSVPTKMGLLIKSIELIDSPLLPEFYCKLCVALDLNIPIRTYIGKVILDFSQFKVILESDNIFKVYKKQIIVK